MATATAPADISQSSFGPAVAPQVNQTTDKTKKKSIRLTLWPLVAATFFMVSGGTYGTEDIIHGAGYGRGILLLLITPKGKKIKSLAALKKTKVAVLGDGNENEAFLRRTLEPTDDAASLRIQTVPPDSTTCAGKLTFACAYWMSGE